MPTTTEPDPGRAAAGEQPPDAGRAAAERRENASSEALTRAYHAVDAVALMLEDPALIKDEPIWKGAASTRRRARPLTHLQAAVWLRRQVSQQVHSEIRKARVDGSSWAEIAVVLDLADADHPTPYDQAIAAYEFAAGNARSYSYECGTCDAQVTDHGPYDSHPDDREAGHTGTCTRRAAAIAEWKTRHPE